MFVEINKSLNNLFPKIHIIIFSFKLPNWIFDNWCAVVFSIWLYLSLVWFAMFQKVQGISREPKQSFNKVMKILWRYHISVDYIITLNCKPANLSSWKATNTERVIALVRWIHMLSSWGKIQVVEIHNIIFNIPLLHRQGQSQQVAKFPTVLRAF